MDHPTKVELPDIGDFSDVEVIEIHVNPGDVVAAEDSILTLESDKATMDVPTPIAGNVVEIAVNVGDKISKGDFLISIETADSTDITEDKDSEAADEAQKTTDEDSVPVHTELEMPSEANDSQSVVLPDIGDFSEVEVIEIHVSVGDDLGIEDPILTLESDKATMEVPSSAVGKVTSITVNVGDKISKGDHLLTLEGTLAPSESKVQPPTVESETTSTSPVDLPKPPPSLPPPVERSRGLSPHASPSVRRIARELGADLSQIRGTGSKGRIVKNDVVSFVKSVMQDATNPDSRPMTGPPPIPEVDFSKFGEVDTVPLSRIKKITGDRLHRSWLDIPHVTHHDEADITELERFRKEIDAEHRASGIRVTILSFICKAIVNALQQYPTFNASLSADQQSLIVKKYINIGIAIDTENGLVVPVIKDIQNLGVLEIAKTLQQVGQSARDSRLTPSDFQGGCFTISSLGGIGGRFFTPIINPPEVAILGISRHKSQPFPLNDSVTWKTMLPLSLSYDHRVIDGAEAARFTKFVGELLCDSRRILL